MAMETLVVGKCGNASTPVELIKGDNYTQKIMMRVPRYFGGVDLAPLAWSVTVENAAGATDEYALSAIRGEDAIEMEWIPGGTATAVPGIVKFKLSGFGEDRNILVWQSGTYHIRVKDTFSHTPGSETAAELTEVQKLIIYVDGELNKVIKAGNDAAEAAKAANKAADRANSVADGKNEGRITALEQFTTKPGEPYAVTGKLVQLDNFEGMPMNVVTRIEPVQAGSGEPSPSNIRPISGHTGAKLTSCGKNLLNVPSAININSTTSTANRVYQINCKLPAGTYTVSLSGYKPDNNGTQHLTFYYMGLDGNEVYPGASIYQYNTHYSFTFTALAGIEWCAVYVNVADDTYTVDNLMLELGSTATEYEPYQGETFSASFGQTVYGGTLDWNTGVLTVDRLVKIASDASDIASWYENVNGTAAICILATDAVALGGDKVSDVLCSHAATVSANEQYLTNNTVVSSSGGNIAITVKDMSTAADMGAFLADQYAAGTPVQVCYKMATPTIIQLTPAQLTALQGKNNIFCDAGETTVSGRKDILWLTSGLIEQIDTLKKAIISLGGNV